VDIGAGPGSTSLGFPDPNERVNQQDMEMYRAMLPYLEWMAPERDARHTRHGPAH